jgi:hypothetical protein
MSKFLVGVQVTRIQKGVVIVETNSNQLSYEELYDAEQQAKALDKDSLADMEITSVVRDATILPDNLTSDQLHLVSNGYPLDKVLALTGDDAEGEVDAITYGP